MSFLGDFCFFAQNAYRYLDHPCILTIGSNDGYEFPWREPEPWDIANDLEHPRTLQLDDITSGTWMALDLSPDGQTIVFDLLGDLYTLPITGGAMSHAHACASSVLMSLNCCGME